MDDRYVVSKTRAKSSDSADLSPESSGSNARGVGESPCGSDVTSASRTRNGKVISLMPPQEKLRYCESLAKDHEDNQEADACIHDLVRCVALTKLVYGEGHLKLSQAHAKLAEAYLHLKGFGLQAKEHASLARELLPFSPRRGEKQEVLACLLSTLLTHGGAALLTLHLEEAESSFLEAKQILEELHQNHGISQEEKIKKELDMSIGLSRVYRKQNRPEEALNQCQKSLELLNLSDKPEKMCSVYRDMATVEQDRGNMDRVVAHLSKAHAIAMSHTPEALEGAQISHSLALILSAAGEPQHNDSASHYFEQCLSSYENIAGPQDPEFLVVQDDFCRFLLLTGQQERCVEIQRASLPSKRSVFGDLSMEVADTLQLIGSVEMTEGLMYQAHRTMTKCLETQSLLYGPQHKRTKATQNAVDMLARAPEVAHRLHRHGRRK